MTRDEVTTTLVKSVRHVVLTNPIWLDKSNLFLIDPASQ